MRKIFHSFFLLLAVSVLAAAGARACESCSCALSRASGEHALDQKNWFFDATMEGVDWDSRDAQAAHTLHHQGHDVHNKTHEEFYHFSLGMDPVEELTLFAELPYVARHSTDVDNHATLGQKQTSEGLGDMKLSAIYRFWRKGNDFLGLVAGVKLPTGATGEKNPQGTRFEPELQPGSGSTDATVGGAFQAERLPFTLHGNALYTFKNEGDQDFRFGDLFSSYLFLDTAISPAPAPWQAWLGVDVNLQAEGKHEVLGVASDDSGGTTLLLGPSLKIKMNDRVSIFGNILLPVVQDLGGVHQEQDFIWNASAKIAW